ncbi:hypothetical protein ACFL27_02500 [candidate division CSSED10-310 bacterium]|uniref:Uncharacterized protein n=1 Tax=candidate division CSSED10-310 bacterium TaxID=2855610 RepID=A0ABV6YS77_UNCC1
MKFAIARIVKNPLSISGIKAVACHGEGRNQPIEKMKMEKDTNYLTKSEIVLKESNLRKLLYNKLYD